MIIYTRLAVTDSFHKVCLSSGAGYIGSHIWVMLLNAGVGLTMFDNFCNSHPLAFARVTQITGKEPTWVQGAIIQESASIGAALRPIDAFEVILFVGSKSVCESVKGR